MSTHGQSRVPTISSASRKILYRYRHANSSRTAAVWQRPRQRLGKKWVLSATLSMHCSAVRRMGSACSGASARLAAKTVLNTVR